MLHFRLKKRVEITTYKKVGSLLSTELLGDIEEEAPAIPPRRLRKPVIDTSNLFFAADNPLRMLVVREKIEDLKGESHLLRASYGCLENHGQ